MQAVFGLGLAALGRPGYINLGHAEDLGANYAVSAMRKHAHEIFDAARDLGIRYFDAARSYGRAEEFLASWIRARDIQPGEITVGSKWGYAYTAAWRVETPAGVDHEVKRHELKVLQSQFHASRGILIDHLDLYQIHSATIESGVLEDEGILNCLNGLRESGFKIGLTVSGTGQAETIEKALNIRFDDELLFASVQATWNLLETSAANALQRANEAGMDVIVKESLANGRLTSRNSDAHLQDRLVVLEKAAGELETTVDALALAAVINQDWATTVLCGAATETHLRSNLKARFVDWNVGLAERLSELQQTSEEYWSDRARLAWN